MDGIHDLGGLQGFGPIRRETDEPVFHAPWEARVYALSCAAPYAVSFGDDQFRPAIEALDPVHYLRASYYEKWLEATVALLRDKGTLSDDELSGRVAPRPLPQAVQPLAAAAVPAAILAGASHARPAGPGVAARFKAGDRVRTRAHMRARHTRLPRYARGRNGVVESVQGVFLVADRNAEGDATPETLYTVVFDSRELWGAEAPAGDQLSLDLWDSYLEPRAREGLA